MIVEGNWEEHQCSGTLAESELQLSWRGGERGAAVVVSIQILWAGKA